MDKDNIYVCECGGKDCWSILKDRIVCTDCGEEYLFTGNFKLCDPQSFNAQRKYFKIKDKKGD